MNKRTLALVLFAVAVVGSLSWAGGKVRELQQQVHAAQQ